jgi:hypothetical protein
MPPKTSNSVTKIPATDSQGNLRSSVCVEGIMPPIAPRTTHKLGFIGTPLPKANTPISPEETLIFFDWDDTCIASTWLQANGFTMYDARGPLIEKYAVMGETLYAVLEPLLLYATQLGRVIIVTNANVGWVELSCAAFMPKLLSFISNITVISAQDRYKPIVGQSPLEWKRRAFQDVVMNSGDPYDQLRNFISIGDGIPEKYAIHALRGNPGDPFYMPAIIVKAVKLLDQPTPSLLVEQLIAVHDMLKSVIHHPSSADFTAELTLLPQLPRLPESGSETEEELAITVVPRCAEVKYPL